MVSPISPTIGRHDVPPLFKELLRIDAMLFERDVYGSHVLKAEASELDYTYHDRWRASDHEEEREEDLEFSRQIDMKARPWLVLNCDEDHDNDQILHDSL